MMDQASELRELVRRQARLGAETPDARARLVTVSGAKGGVGTTTVAVNLAIALAQQGCRTALVDADPDRGDAAVLCRLDEGCTVDDVLCSRCRVEEVIQSGPGGVHVLPGAWHTASRVDDASIVRRRLFEPLAELGERFDLVVIDAGNGANAIVKQAWRAADLVLLVATTELPSVMDAYASIKLLADDHVGAPIHSLVNMAGSPAVAFDVHARLDRACRRFLAMRLNSAGHISCDAAVVAAGNGGEPLVLAAPGSPAAAELRQLAGTVASALGVFRAKTRSESTKSRHEAAPAMV